MTPEQMYQEVSSPRGAETSAWQGILAPNAAVESSPRTQRPCHRTSSHEYCTPGNRTSSTRTCGDEATIHVGVSDDEPHSIKRIGVDGHATDFAPACR